HDDDDPQERATWVLRPGAASGFRRAGPRDDPDREAQKDDAESVPRSPGPTGPGEPGECGERRSPGDGGRGEPHPRPVGIVPGKAMVNRIGCNGVHSPSNKLPL